MLNQEIRRYYNMKNMFSVNLTLNIVGHLEEEAQLLWDDDHHASFTWLYKDIHTPFVPFIGLELVETGKGYSGGKIISVSWGILDSCFFCRVADKYLKPYSFSYLELVDRYIEAGWVLGARNDYPATRIRKDC